MPNSERGGSSEQHAKAGEQGHKNTTGSGSKESGSEGSTRGSSHEQQVKAATRADRVRRNPGLKAQLAAARTSSMSRRANRAIKIADDYRGRFVRPCLTLSRA